MVYGFSSASRFCHIRWLRSEIALPASSGVFVIASAHAASTPSRSYCWVQPLQLHASVGGGELPVGLDVLFVAAVLPCGNFLGQGRLVGDAPIETLAE